MKRGAFLRFPGDYIFALADHRLLAIEDDPGAGRSIASDLKHISVKGDTMAITGYDEAELLSEVYRRWRGTRRSSRIYKRPSSSCVGPGRPRTAASAKFGGRTGGPFWVVVS